MRTLIFGVALTTVAAAGFHTLILASLDAARDARPATFSERFAPVLKPVLIRAAHIKKPAQANRGGLEKRWGDSVPAENTETARAV